MTKDKRLAEERDRYLQGLLGHLYDPEYYRLRTPESRSSAGEALRPQRQHRRDRTENER